MKWIDEDGTLFPISDNFKTYVTPGPGIFNLVAQKTAGGGIRIGLRKVSEKFDFSFKIYNLGYDEFFEKVKNTWNSDYFMKKNQNLGVALVGLKGSGKTIGAKQLCNSMDMPVIVVNDYIPGSMEFISAIPFECTVFIDEAEKIYNDNDDMEAVQSLLKMLDGSASACRKLFILAVNRFDIDDNMIGRPGRIRYIKHYNRLDSSVLKAFVDDNLLYKDSMKEVINVIQRLNVSTIDTTKAIVDEVNMNGGKIPEVTDLNLEFKFMGVRTLVFEKEKNYNSFRNFLSKYYDEKKNGSIYKWLIVTELPGELESKCSFDNHCMDRNYFEYSDCEANNLMDKRHDSIENYKFHMSEYSRVMFDMGMTETTVYPFDLRKGGRILGTQIVEVLGDSWYRLEDGRIIYVEVIENPSSYADLAY